MFPLKDTTGLGAVRSPVVIVAGVVNASELQQPITTTAESSGTILILYDQSIKSVYQSISQPLHVLHCKCYTRKGLTGQQTTSIESAVMGMASIQSGTGETGSSGVCTTNWTSSVVDPPHAAECTQKKQCMLYPVGRTLLVFRAYYRYYQTIPVKSKKQSNRYIVGTSQAISTPTHKHTHTQPTD